MPSAKAINEATLFVGRNSFWIPKRSVVFAEAVEFRGLKKYKVFKFWKIFENESEEVFTQEAQGGGTKNSGNLFQIASKGD